MRIKTLILTLGVLLPCGGVLAVVTPQSLPCTNDFDAFPDGTPVPTLAGVGWDASSNTVVVQTGVISSMAPNVGAVLIPKRMVVSNSVTSVAGLSNVWFDSEVVMVPDVETTTPPVYSNAVVLVAPGSNGFLRVYDRSIGAWRSLSNDLALAGMTALTNGQWARVSIHQNYATHQCSVFLDGRALIDRLPFVSNVNQSTTFRLVGGDQDASYLDTYGMTLAVPAGLALDVNGNDLADAQELVTYGYLGKTFEVGPGKEWTDIQQAVDQALGRDVISVTDPGPYGAVFIQHAVGGLTGQVFTLAGPMGIGAGLAVTSQVGFTCGDLTVADNATLVVMGAINASNVLSGTGSTLVVSAALTGLDLVLGTNSVTIVGQNLSGSNLTLNAGALFSVTGDVSVLAFDAGPATTFSVGGGLICQTLTEAPGATGAVAGALTTTGPLSLDVNAVLNVGGTLNGSALTLASGSRLSTAGSLFVTGSVSVSASAQLFVNGQFNGRDVSVSGGLGLASGGSLSCTNLTVDNNVIINLTNATVTASNLVISTGGRLVVVNGAVLANGLTLTGSFTLDEYWANSGVSSTLPFFDNFDSYEAGVSVNSLGFRGWGASTNRVVVESAHTYGGSSRAVGLGYAESFSNRLDTSHPTNVWTDFRGVLAYGTSDDIPVANATAVALVYVNSNGYLTVWNNGVWDVCTSDVWQAAVPVLANGQWAHVSVHNNFIRKETAVMLDGRLLRDRVPFVNMAADHYSTFRVVNDHTNEAYIDEVLIQQPVPESLAGTDAGSVQIYGSAMRGAVFYFR